MYGCMDVISSFEATTKTKKRNTKKYKSRQGTSRVYSIQLVKRTLKRDSRVALVAPDHGSSFTFPLQAILIIVFRQHIPYLL